MDLLKRLEKIVGSKGFIQEAEDMAGYLTEWRDKYEGKALAVISPKLLKKFQRLLQFAPKQTPQLYPKGAILALSAVAFLSIKAMKLFYR